MGIPSYNAEKLLDPNEERVWRIVAHSPLESLWSLHAYSLKDMSKRVGSSVLDDRVFGRAAELGFYFFFSLFPTLFCAASILGIVARSAHQIYTNLLGYMSLVIPTSALATVMKTFNQTAAHATSGKITFGLMGAIWSASVGISAIQDTLNDVYKIPDTRSYFGARLRAIGLTLLLIAIVSVTLTCMFGGDFVAKYFRVNIADHTAAAVAGVGIRVVAWVLASALLVLNFAVVYYWAPDWRKKRWRWLTPGGTIGVIGWLLASLGLRIYLHYFNTYSLTYGSLGAVIILLTWFYITGLMLLLGGEINSEIEAAAIERRLQLAGKAKLAQPGAAA
jgi:membrane protein